MEDHLEPVQSPKVCPIHPTIRLNLRCLEFLNNITEKYYVMHLHAYNCASQMISLCIHFSQQQF